jgi:hypothetical protein
MTGPYRWAGRFLLLIAVITTGWLPIALPAPDQPARSRPSDCDGQTIKCCQTAQERQGEAYRGDRVLAASYQSSTAVSQAMPAVVIRVQTVAHTDLVQAGVGSC